MEGQRKTNKGETVPPTFLDTQSSLKLTTVYAVSEDSHRGGPVLLMKKTHTHTPTHTQTVQRGEHMLAVFTGRRSLILDYKSQGMLHNVFQVYYSFKKQNILVRN